MRPEQTETGSLSDGRKAQVGFPAGLLAPPTTSSGLPSSPAGPTSRPLWQTPSAQQFTKRRQHGSSERNEELLPIQAQMGNRGLRLNPKFVEWLMGFPLDWLEGSRVNQLTALGNSCVPAQAAAAFRRLWAVAPRG